MEKIITLILFVILAFGFSFGIVSGFVWLACWGLSALKLPIAIEFSWKLAVAVWAIITLLGFIFKK